MLNIVIFGAPGSGKGTQSEKIVEKYGINHISTGDVLRAEIKNGTELGKTAKSYIDQGQLIPDELMIDILASVFDSFEDSKGVIFDGFPRTIAQAEALKKMLADAKCGIPVCEGCKAYAYTMRNEDSVDAAQDRLCKELGV